MSRSAESLDRTAVWNVAVAPRATIDALGRRTARPSLLDRFMSNARADGDCWVWTKSLTSRGYALFYVRSIEPVVAHRWIYTLMVAEIPDGLQLDHLCRRRACVCPWHLDPVDNRENQRRGEHPTSGVAFRTNICPKGHSLADAYISTTKATGKQVRRCRPCQRERFAAYEARKRGLAA